MTAPSRSIFLSYARCDGQAAAEKLGTYLKDPAFTCGEPLALWQDLTCMLGGEWREQIRAAIKTGDHLLMVVTPGSLKSEVCAWEWYTARLEGAEINPVLAGAVLTPEDLPKWMRAQHIYRLDLDASDLASNREWQRLVTSLREPPRSRRMPIVTREPGDHFVPRPKEMDALREMLLDANGDAIGITTAFRGSGGMGKTTLALALARDDRIRSAFYHGQLLIELGQNPNLLLALTSAVCELTGETSAAQTISAAASELARALANRCVLLLIDDLWDRAHLVPFLHEHSTPEQRGCARLVTTRDVETLPPPRPGESRNQVPVDEMTPGQALALLESGLRKREVPHAESRSSRRRFIALAKRLGHCAQVLDLARGRLELRILEGCRLDGALDDAETSYDSHGVVAFDNSSSSAREDSYARCIGASLDMLATEQKARLLELAIFPEDTDIPYGTVALLWRETASMAQRDTPALLYRFQLMSLVKPTGSYLRERDTRAIRLHDVIRTYLRDPKRQSPEQLKVLNRRLWSAYENARPQAFEAELACGQYAYARLPWHLNEANEKEILGELLLRPCWLKDKLEATSSPLALVRDYEQFGQGLMQQLIGRTLRL